MCVRGGLLGRVQAGFIEGKSAERCSLFKLSPLGFKNVDERAYADGEIQFLFCHNSLTDSGLRLLQGCSSVSSNRHFQA